MTRVLMVALAIGLAVSAAPVQAQARAGEEWKWGVNFYDLQLHSIPDEGSAVEADVCASALLYMASVMMDLGEKDTQHQLATFSNAWKGEGMKRHQIDAATYDKNYLLPAFSLMTNLEHEDAVFWSQHCVALTGKAAL